MSASPQEQINECCRISQLLTWITTIKLVEKYETANWSFRQGDEVVNKKKNTYATVTTGTEHRNESEKTTGLNVINLSGKLPDFSYLLALLLQNNGV